MTTDTIESPEAVECPAQADAPPDADAVRAQVEAIDPGPVARDDDERLLHRYLRVRAQVSAERTRVKEQMEAMVRELDSKLKTLDWIFLPSAERIAREKLHGAKARSIKTPFGTVGFRKVGGGIVVTDADKVPAAFKRVTREEVILRAELAAHVKASGEVPPGCDLTPKVDRFYVA